MRVFLYLILTVAIFYSATRSNTELEVCKEGDERCITERKPNL
jgi:hypothetical protein